MNIRTNSLRKISTRDPGLTATDLKTIALITMIIDHIGATIIATNPAIADHNSTVYIVYSICRLIGRVAFPIYCFFLVEGFLYTSSRLKYGLRLLFFFLISEIPYDLARHKIPYYWNNQNVFLALLLGLIMMCGFEYIRDRENQTVGLPMWVHSIIKYVCLLGTPVYLSFKTVYYLKKYSSFTISLMIIYMIAWAAWVVILYRIIQYTALNISYASAISLCLDIMLLTITMFVADSVHTDYTAAGILAIACMYLFRNDYYKRITIGCIVLAAMSSSIELGAFLTIPIISKYNGKRGSGPKYLFYAMYPLHLLFLYAVWKLL